MVPDILLRDHQLPRLEHLRWDILLQHVNQRYHAYTQANSLQRICSLLVPRIRPWLAHRTFLDRHNLHHQYPICKVTVHPSQPLSGHPLARQGPQHTGNQPVLTDLIPLVAFSSHRRRVPRTPTRRPRDRLINRTHHKNSGSHTSNRSKHTRRRNKHTRRRHKHIRRNTNHTNRHPIILMLYNRDQRLASRHLMWHHQASSNDNESHRRADHSPSCYSFLGPYYGGTQPPPPSNYGAYQPYQPYHQPPPPPPSGTLENVLHSAADTLGLGDNTRRQLDNLAHCKWCDYYLEVRDYNSFSFSP